jgi:Sec-independent protein secretion pathway component TatC
LENGLIVILISAAVLSPTNDIPNMMLFAAPMLVLYVISIFVAWIFNKPEDDELNASNLQGFGCVLGNWP